MLNGHWAENDIQNLTINGILSGYKDNTFKPNNNMTRAELVTIINRMLNNSEQDSRYIPDLDTKKWYYSEMRKAMASGIIQGDVEGNVRPNDLITREEAVVMIGRALVPSTDSLAVLDFTDSDKISSWAEKYISEFVYSKYISRI